ncbi:MAG TPA: NAD-dependent epimerase/dehydratase family protein [Acidimicrobiales bacterium]|jgi:dTDP-L-rhamnose 4-epimerase|nr:NAD-dependent epimerase/dehydratase family protein [Acidimicrobiales bacterium]
MRTSSNGPFLLTGGAGFIGCALARRLVQRGWGPIYIADNLHQQVHPTRRLPQRVPREAIFLPFDVSQDAPWEAVLNLVRPRCVVHLAAETGTGQSLTQASRHALVNVVGTAQLLDALTRTAIIPDHLLLTSSRAVYGEGLWSSDGQVHAPSVRRHSDLAAGRWLPIGLKEALPLAARQDRTPANPTSVYGATKLAQEQLMRVWAASTGSKLSILRFQNVYGPGQSIANPYTGIVTLFAQQAKNRQTIDIYEDGEIIRDFVFIDDVTTALERCIELPPDDERLLDIGSGSATTVLELGRLVANIYGAPEPMISGRFRDGDVRAAWADITLSKEAIGFSPSVTLEDGLKQLVTWMEDER